VSLSVRKSPSARRKHRDRNQQVRPLWRTVRLTMILSFLCLVVTALGFTLAENAQGALGQDAQTTNTCNPTLITTSSQTHPEKWFSINTGSESDILSAVQCTDMFQMDLHGNDLIAYALQTGTLAAPMLVKPYRSDVGLAQYWVVPVVGTNNLPLALLTFFYDPTSRLVHESEFDAVTNNMFYVTHPFPAVPANAATGSVKAEHRVSIAQGRTPELIYFPGDHLGFVTGKYTWNGGGTAVIDPIWRVPGAEGKWHYVDHNGHAHLSTELPLDPNYQSVPATTDTQ
jgi:hypothetical protein